MEESTNVTTNLTTLCVAGHHANGNVAMKIERSVAETKWKVTKMVHIAMTWEMVVSVAMTVVVTKVLTGTLTRLTHLYSALRHEKNIVSNIFHQIIVIYIYPYL